MTHWKKLVYLGDAKNGHGKFTFDIDVLKKVCLASSSVNSIFELLEISGLCIQVLRLQDQKLCIAQVEMPCCTASTKNMK